MHPPKTFLIVQYINIYSIYHGFWFWSGDDDGGRRVQRAVENSGKVQPARLEVINIILVGRGDRVGHHHGDGDGGDVKKVMENK